MRVPRRPTADEAAHGHRLARFRADHPEVHVREGAGYWQAVKPEPNGETIVTGYLLGDLMDKLGELYGGKPDPDSG